MIYQFKNGPLDGTEADIPEMPVDAIFRHPMERSILPTLQDFDPNLQNNPEDHYRVTDIGDMTFDHYEG